MTNTTSSLFKDNHDRGIVEDLFNNNIYFIVHNLISWILCKDEKLTYSSRIRHKSSNTRQRIWTTHRCIKNGGNRKTAQKMDSAG